MKKITFIHAADLHLDSPMVGLKHLPKTILNRLRESTFIALKKITEAAIHHHVDFVIFAGDLFDGEDRSLRAQSLFRNEMEKLAAKKIPVYVIHGNHDHLNGSWVKIDMPPNVHVFGNNVEGKVLKIDSKAIVHLYGFSYEQRHVTERKIEEYSKIEGADYHIGMIHGHDGGSAEHGVYAPFLLKDLLDKKFDYWALGHIHKSEILSEDPPVVYPGNIQGRNKKETGQKGCYLVSLSKLESKLEFQETADVIWEEVVIDASSSNHFQDIYQLCRLALDNLRKDGIGTIVTIRIQNANLENVHEQTLIATELIEMLQDEEKDERSFVWVRELEIQYDSLWNRNTLAHEIEFYGELFKQSDGYENLDSALSSLYDDHHLGRRYLSRLSTEEQQQLLQRAESLLLNLLHH